MKAILNHKKFAKALQYTLRAVNAKPNIPILSNVLIEIEKTDIKLSTTNLDMGINMWIPGAIEIEGSITVSAKYITDFVTASFSDKIEIIQQDNTIIIKNNKSKANFATIPSTEFPILPKIIQDPLFTIDANELIMSLEKVIFACSTDLSSGKIQQSGVLFEIENDQINFVGLDGFRLSKRIAKVQNFQNTQIKDQIIVPSKYLNEVIKIMQDYEEIESVKVYLSDNKSQLIFKFEEIEISIRLIEGPYPDYKKIIPTESSFSFDIKKLDLEEGIKIINTFARSNLSNKTLLDLDIENSQIKLRSILAEVGENETTVPVFNPSAPSDLNAAYNLKYLQDIVAHIPGEDIKIETKGALAPSIFKDKNDENFIHLLMPLRRDI